MADPPAAPHQPITWWWRILLLLVVGLIIVGAFCLATRFTRDEPVAYDQIEEHFKYGSLGGERESGIPYWIWKVLPKLFPEYLPGKKYVAGQEYASLGFIYEPGKDLPIGVSKRNTQGIDRVFLNCAACHAGSVRETAQSPRALYTGMPSNTVDLEAFQRFIFNCAADPRFNADRLMCEMEALGSNYDLLNRTIMRYYAIPFMRERLLMLKDRFRFIEWEPDEGPGRTDTFNPAKTLVNYPLEKMETREIVGICDLPSIWLQGPRRDRDMQLHWDGNQRKMEERNKNASFGTGAFPPTIDLAALQRIEDWLIDKAPPKYPFPINEPLRAQGEKIYGAILRRLPRTQRPRLQRRARRPGHADRGDRDRSSSARFLHARDRGHPQHRSTPAIRGASVISAKPSATRTRRSTASGCARRICTTAPSRRCAIC